MVKYFYIFILLSLSTVAGDKPNVVFILSDDQAWGDYGFMGSTAVKTPHLDKLANESLVFKRGYVTSPLCRPSLASMVTGLYVHKHGVTGNDVDGMNNRARLDIPVQKYFHKQNSFIKKLVSEGYLAHQSGKWWEGSWQDGGFTHGMTHGDPGKGGRHGDAGLKIGRENLKPVTDFIDHAVSKDKPFLLWYAPFLPHTPHNPPERILKKYNKLNLKPDVAKYYAMIEWFDETCGELLGHIKKNGLEKNTLVIYICDNGWKAKSQSTIPIPENWSFKYAPMSKGSPFENGIRTPIMFKFPGKIKPQFSDDLASAVDLYPTILKACEINSEAEVDGINLLDETQRRERESIYGASYSIHNMVVGKPSETRQYHWVISGKWKYLVRDNGVDTTRYKFVHLWDKTQERLFDLQQDPEEKNNLVKDHPDVLSDLKKNLSNWSGSQ